jgi:hypothetical protein
MRRPRDPGNACCEAALIGAEFDGRAGCAAFSKEPYAGKPSRAFAVGNLCRDCNILRQATGEAIWLKAQGARGKINHDAAIVALRQGACARLGHQLRGLARRQTRIGAAQSSAEARRGKPDHKAKDRQHDKQFRQRRAAARVSGF